MQNKARRHMAARSAVAVAVLVVSMLLGIWLWRAFPLLDRPFASLHSEQDAGYIPVAAQVLDIALQSPQAFIYDCETDEIIYQKGEEKVLYPASTTKLLTILCALEYLSPDEIITPGDELALVEAGSSVAYIKEHHALSVEMLIEGMLLPSGNDAAYVLAAAAGNRIDPSGTGADAVAVFMDAMAEYGSRIGLVGTRFTTPDGLAKKEHYSTVEDMILIARTSMQSDIIRRYAALHEDSVTYASGHTNHWVNTNELLDPDSAWYHASVTGLKTGSLERNYCLVFTVEDGERTYIVGLFGAKEKTQRYADAHTVIDALLGHEEVAR